MKLDPVTLNVTFFPCNERFDGAIQLDEGALLAGKVLIVEDPVCFLLISCSQKTEIVPKCTSCVRVCILRSGILGADSPEGSRLKKK